MPVFFPVTDSGWPENKKSAARKAADAYKIFKFELAGKIAVENFERLFDAVGDFTERENRFVNETGFFHVVHSRKQGIVVVIKVENDQRRVKLAKLLERDDFKNSSSVPMPPGVTIKAVDSDSMNALRSRIVRVKTVSLPSSKRTPGCWKNTGQYQSSGRFC
nr:hypothetical protein [Allobaculum sp. Allo2]